LEVGGQGEQVTVEVQAEAFADGHVPLGTTVGASTVTQLPRAPQYTQILALSAGPIRGANNATAFGKGTQNMSVNGNDPGQKQLPDGRRPFTNFANSGSANDAGLYAGVGHTKSRRLQEFKVQTSTYDASYGRIQARM